MTAVMGGGLPLALAPCTAGGESDGTTKATQRWTFDDVTGALKPPLPLPGSPNVSTHTPRLPSCCPNNPSRVARCSPHRLKHPLPSRLHTHALTNHNPAAVRDCWVAVRASSGGRDSERRQRGCGRERGSMRGELAAVLFAALVLAKQDTTPSARNHHSLYLP